MNNRDIHFSKSLSWLLRHGAVKEGLQLSPEGYIEVEEILKHNTFQGKCSVSDIERIVKDNDKQRFKLRVNPNSQHLEIKANQGHSISEVTDAELTPILEPKYSRLVHGTFLKCWPQIKQTGLSRMRRRHIHFAKDPTSINLRTNIQVHVYIDLERALNDGLKFYESENGVVLTPGNEKGFLETKYFVRVDQVATGKQLYP